jgi:hypothetical protein
LKRLNSTSEQAVQYYCDATGADSCQSLAREAGRLCEGTRLQELATELGKDGMSGFSQKMRSLFGPDHSNAELEEVSCFPPAAPEVKAAQVTSSLSCCQLDLLLGLIDPILHLLCTRAVDGSLCSKQAAKVPRRHLSICSPVFAACVQPVLATCRWVSFLQGQS